MKKILSIVLVASLLFVSLSNVVLTEGMADTKYKEYYGMLQKGNRIAELQNIYMQVYQDKQAYNVVYNSLKQYIPDGLSCRVWFGDYTWKFVTKYSTVECVQKVLWFGYDAAGEVRAFCTGTYDYSTELFSNISWNYYGRVELQL